MEYLNEKSTLKEAVNHAKNVRHVADEINFALYGETWSEREKRFSDMMKKEEENVRQDDQCTGSG